MAYWCSECGKETQPRLWTSGGIVGAKCCEEAPLLVVDETCVEIECALPSLRLIRNDEERDLIEELMSDEQAEWTPEMRARHRAMSGS